MAWITDRTILEIVHRHGDHPKGNTLDKESLSKLANLIQQAGAGFQELDAASARYIEIFPPNAALIYRASDINEVQIIRKYGFPIVAVSIKEYAKPCWKDFFDSYTGQVMLEIECNRIDDAYRVFRSYEGYEGKDNTHISCIRLRGLQKQEPWLVNEDTTRLRQKYGVQICLTPRNTLDTAGAICIEGMGVADYVTASFCGLGGWAALEEVLMAFIIIHGAETEIHAGVLSEAAGLFSALTGEGIPPQKPVLGNSIFRCESGIHADGLYKDPTLYEPYPPELTGHQREIVIGKHSGVASLLRKLKELDIGDVDTEKARKVLGRVREKSVELKRFLYPDEVRRIAEEYDDRESILGGKTDPRMLSGGSYRCYESGLSWEKEYEISNKMYMNTKIIDTTLRDGEQQPGIAFGLEEKIRIARYLDSLGIYQIEAGVPAMGGDEKESVRRIAGLGLRSRIAAWNRLNLEDIKHSMDCSVDVIHISVPSSDLHIAHKLNKSREWVATRLEQCINYAIKEDFEVMVGFEDATRADFDFILQLCSICRSRGVKAVRYADTLGIATPSKIYEIVRALQEITGLEIGIHVHNDLGMALVNSFAALTAGATYIDCTLNGMGERAGNCDYYKLAKLLEKAPFS